jgi:hypothetical protein
VDSINVSNLRLLVKANDTLLVVLVECAPQSFPHGHLAANLRKAIFGDSKQVVIATAEIATFGGSTPIGYRCKTRVTKPQLCLSSTMSFICKVNIYSLVYRTMTKTPLI